MKLLGALIFAATLAPDVAWAEARFFLVVSPDVPTQGLIDASFREAQVAGQPVRPEVAKERLGRAFPRLFTAGAPGERATIIAELKAGTAAHYAANFEQAEKHFARAFALTYEQPELLDGSDVMMKRLVNGAALRYGNATAASRDVPEAKRQLVDFVRRFPTLLPTRSEHPPPILELWETTQAELMQSPSRLMVHVEPLSLEREGNCRLHINGADLSRLPLSTPVPLPRGNHTVQVRCGLQRGWVQQVTLTAEPRTVRMPVRAMLSARAESRSGGIVLTQPEAGDAAHLVTAISEAAGFDGAVVVRMVTRAAHIGRWERGADGPTLERRGTLTQDNIRDVEDVHASGGGGDRMWTWIVGGVGIAALGGGVALHVMHDSDVDDPTVSEGDLGSLQTASTALYITGGVLLATAIALYFLEGPGDDDEEAAAPEPQFRAGPGFVRLTF